MAKQTKSPRSLEELFTDPAQFKLMQDHLYSGKPILERGGGFAELLHQYFIRPVLNGCLCHHISA